MTVSFTRQITIIGDVALVPLTKGYDAIIDAGNEPMLRNWNWFAMFVGKIIYARRNLKVCENLGHGVVLMHRVITDAPDNLVVDHINGNGLDNRRARGVYWDKWTNKWMAAIGHNGKFHNLGRFNSVEEAHEAYVAAAKDKFGEFARLS